ncbi:MAG: hypothetical protein M1832_002319 [Thelocarpon impressellum]|nr:MAG: hypothetical protein M1832_002319 [Thelocarpon impressellum]
MAIPKVSSCACGNPSTPWNESIVPSTPISHNHKDDDVPPPLPSPPFAASNRVQKPSQRRSSQTSASVVKAMRDANDKELQSLQDTQQYNLVLGTAKQAPQDHRSHCNSPAALSRTMSTSSRHVDGHSGVGNHSDAEPTHVFQPSAAYDLSGGKNGRQHTRHASNGLTGPRGQSEQVSVSAKTSCCSKPVQEGTPTTLHSQRPNPGGSHLDGQHRPPPTAPYSGLGVVEQAPRINGLVQYQPTPQQSTTLYSFPPSYSTFQHPLTPDELAFLQRNPQLFSRSVPVPAFVGPPSQPPPATPSDASTPHNCNCGNSCNCLGCAAHPYNRRTMTFVQSLNDIMEEAVQQLGPVGGPQALGSPVSFDPAMVSGQFSGYPLAGSSNGWPQAVATDGQWPAMQPGRASGPPHTLGEYPDVHTRSRDEAREVAARSMSVDEDNNTDEQSISPTAFFHVNYPSGSCAEDENVCFCGDGCTCVGCIVHTRRHDAPATTSAADVGEIFAGIRPGGRAPPSEVLRSDSLGGRSDGIGVAPPSSQQQYLAPHVTLRES